MPEYTFDQATKELAQEVVSRLSSFDRQEHSYVAYYMESDERGVNNLAQVFADMGLTQSTDQPTVQTKARKFGNV